MKLWLLLSAVLSNLLLLQPAQADSPLEPLLASGALTIDTRLDEQGTLVPGQRAKMIVEIATNTWFTMSATTYMNEMGTEDPGMVRDGTKCGEEMVRPHLKENCFNI